MTLFHQFLGYSPIIGASWMLSIMVVFFTLIAYSKSNVKKYSKRIFYTTCILSVVVGFLRGYTGKELPVAIFLMNSVAMLGLFYKMNGGLKGVWISLVMFEITLFSTTILGYSDKWILYVLSYNVALLLFYFFEKQNVNNISLEKLGELGFTFFLGAGIPISLIFIVFPEFEGYTPWIIVLVKFLTTIPFAWLVTKYIEKPILNFGKEFEKKL